MELFLQKFHMLSPPPKKKLIYVERMSFICFIPFRMIQEGVRVHI